MRRLVVLADGTWKSERDVSDQRSNVRLLYQAVLPVAPDGTPQASYYNRGVGTGPGLDHWLGGLFGLGLSRHVRECYRWLVSEYAEGDEISLFGFSRGAFTVRSLAGLIRNMGILRPENAGRIKEAYDHYRDRSAGWEPDSPASTAYRQRYSWPLPRLACLGVWDTVGSLGIPTPGPLGWLTRRRYGFHDLRLSGIVAAAFQALAIDERRRPFRPALWEADDAYAGEQRVEQVWFAGTHTNVGGGWIDPGLSDIALLWMAARAKECALAFDEAFLASRHPRFDGRINDSYTGLYRLLCPLIRQIGHCPFTRAGHTFHFHESVAPTALERLDAHLPPPLGPYRPPNLLSYLCRDAAAHPGL